MNLLAYIDPGFGSIVFQAFVAGLLGIVFFFKSMRYRIAMFFSSLFGRNNSNKTDDTKP